MAIVREEEEETGCSRNVVKEAVDVVLSRALSLRSGFGSEHALSQNVTASV